MCVGALIGRCVRSDRRLTSTTGRVPNGQSIHSTSAASQNEAVGAPVRRRSHERGSSGCLKGGQRSCGHRRPAAVWRGGGRLALTSMARPGGDREGAAGRLAIGSGAMWRIELAHHEFTSKGMRGGNLQRHAHGCGVQCSKPALQSYGIVAACWQPRWTLVQHHSWQGAWGAPTTHCTSAENSYAWLQQNRGDKLGPRRLQTGASAVPASVARGCQRHPLQAGEAERQVYRSPHLTLHHVVC